MTIPFEDSNPRYAFQHRCLQRVEGRVLNAGCKEDPAGLRETAPGRVVNLDLRNYDHDQFYNYHRMVAIPVDVVHDLTAIPWPFEDDSFDLVILAEILEDLPDNGCQVEILKEAHRIAKCVGITTPEDTPERDWHHLTTITEQRLRDWLAQAGWETETFEVVNYGFVPRGYFVYAHRANP